MQLNNVNLDSNCGDFLYNPTAHPLATGVTSNGYAFCSTVTGGEPVLLRQSAPDSILSVEFINGGRFVLVADAQILDDLCSTAPFSGQLILNLASPVAPPGNSCPCPLGGGPVDSPDGRTACEPVADASDRFGTSVAISGDWSVVGTPGDDDFGSSAGAAWVYMYNGFDSWTKLQKLVADGTSALPGNAGDVKGQAVDIRDDLAVVGAPYADTQGSNSGAVYVYRMTPGFVWYKSMVGDPWQEEAVLVPAAAGGNDRTGLSVAVCGDIIAAGAPLDSPRLVGSVTIWEHDGLDWLETATVSPSDGRRSDGFGTSIALDGETLVVGSPNDDDAGSSTGAVYIFHRNGGAWTEDQKLIPLSGDLTLDPLRGDKFGSAVDIAGDLLAVGAPGDDDDLNIRTSNAGSIYTFFNTGGPSGWTPRTRDYALDLNIGDNLGASVAFDCNSDMSFTRVAVGAPGDDEFAPNGGAAYVFDEFGQLNKYGATVSDRNDANGTSVGQNGLTTMSGAPYANGIDAQSNADIGNAYYFSPVR